MPSRLTVALLLAACAADPPVSALDVALSAPAEIAVPAENHIIASAHAVGFQVYECQLSSTGGRTWAFRAPLAALFAEDETLVAVHFGGSTSACPPARTGSPRSTAAASTAATR